MKWREARRTGEGVLRVRFRFCLPWTVSNARNEGVEYISARMGVYDCTLGTQRWTSSAKRSHRRECNGVARRPAASVTESNDYIQRGHAGTRRQASWPRLIGNWATNKHINFLSHQEWSSSTIQERKERTHRWPCVSHERGNAERRVRRTPRSLSRW